MGEPATKVLAAAAPTKKRAAASTAAAAKPATTTAAVLQQQPPTANPASVMGQHLPAEATPIQAYAKLEGPDFSYFVRKLQVMLGRKVGAADQIDINLGNVKSISRKHARIQFNFIVQSFEVVVLGKNGAVVDGRYLPPESPPATLKHNSKITIGEVDITFLLPQLDANGRVESRAEGDDFDRPKKRVRSGSSPLKEGDEGGDSTADARPNVSYATMIYQAICSSAERKMTLNGIYRWISENYPYYQMHKAGWQAGDPLARVKDLKGIVSKDPAGGRHAPVADQPAAPEAVTLRTQSQPAKRRRLDLKSEHEVALAPRGISLLKEKEQLRGDVAGQAMVVVDDKVGLQADGTELKIDNIAMLHRPPPPVVSTSTSATTAVTYTVHSKRKSDCLDARDEDIHDPRDLPLASFTGPLTPRSTPAKTRAFSIVSTQNTPAHARFQHLLTSRLPLPESHALLERLFAALDQSVSFVLARGQTATFERVRRPVENMTGRAFPMDRLEQLRAVWPGSYVWEPRRAVGEDGRWVDSVCLMWPIEDVEGKDVGKRDGGRKAEVGDEMVKRREVFNARLVARVSLEHKVRIHFSFIRANTSQRFLATRNITVSNDAKLKSWHADFDLSSVPEVERMPIPICEKKGKSALARSCFVDATDPLPKLPAVTPVKLENENAPPTPASAGAPTVAFSAQEPIRAKEQKTKESGMYHPKVDSTEIKRRAMLSRLVDIGQAVIVFFTTSKKKVIPLKEVGDYILTASRNPLSHAEACDHVRMLATTCPEWCKLIKLIAGFVVRVEDTITVTDADVADAAGRLRTLKERVGRLLAQPLAK
ncbi:transcription factor [Irineochytrium annulatum]|nr:transcription factor [Irineochytrium annulatum]